MLKLNSNYAKSYLRDTQEERTKPATDRFYPQYSGYDEPKRPLQENDFRREKFDYKQTVNPPQFKNDYSIPNDFKPNKEKTYGYGYQNSNYPNEDPTRREYPEYQARKPRNYDENPLADIDSNYGYKETSNPIPKRNNYTPSYQFEPTRNEQTFEADKNYSRYSKYTQSPKPSIDTNFDKKDYAIKHSRRNQQVKTRLTKQQTYTREPIKGSYQERPQAYENYMNEPTPYETYRNQQQDRQIRHEYPSSYKNNRKVQFQTFQKLDERKPERQPKNYDLPSQYPEQMMLSKRKSEEYTATDRLDRPHLHERKQAIKKSIESTPQKNYKGLQPGSAQRKNSLIQKSQMLQQKLKKLNMQYPVGAQRERERPKEVVNEQTYQRPTISKPNEQAYSRYNPSPVVPNRSTSCLRNSFRNVSITQHETVTAANRNADILRTKSPILQSDVNGEIPNKGEAIEKITKLNEKINQRIQSIISNYAKK